MNSRIILLGLAVAAFSSCSNAYKTGQTPDDVYFSPGKEAAAYVKVENNDDRRYTGEDRYQSEQYRADDYMNSDDRWLRMRVRNRSRWSAFDDYGYNDWGYNNWNHNSYYGNSPFNSYYNYNYSPFNNYWGSYYSWNSFYNPYYTRLIVVNPKNNPVFYNRVRNFNPSSYSNNSYYNPSGRPLRSNITNRGTANPDYYNNNRNPGNSGRRVYSNSNNSSRDTYSAPSERPARTYQPSSSSSSSPSRSSGSSSSGSSSSGSGGVNRPSRN